MNAFLLTTAVSSLLGFLSGLGVGGGSLLMLWMIFVQKLDPGIARAVNLLFFIPSALIASFFRFRQGKLPVRQALPGLISGCVCAAVFAVIGRNLNADLIRKGFGILLLAVGIREILYRPRNRR